MDEKSSLRTNLKSAFTLPNVKSSWSGLSKSQKAGLASLLAIVVVMPLFLIAALTQTSIKPRASQPVTPPDDGFGQAVHLIEQDYQNGDSIFVEPGGSLKINTRSMFTVEAWVNPIKAPGGTYNPPMIFCKTAESGVQNQTPFCLQLGVSGSLFWPTAWIGANGNQYQLSSSIKFAEGSWHHIALTADSRTGLMQMFVDGTLAASENAGTTLVFTDPDLGMTIGSNSHITNGQLVYGYFFDGDIDEVRVSNTVRYTDEFTPPHAPLTTDNNTLALFHFNGNFSDATGQNSATPYGSLSFVTSTIPYVTPTPTPTPGTGRNSKPTFTTTSLPAGQVGVPYSAGITATDADANEALSMTHTALPEGLTWGPCSLSAGDPPTTMQCIIQGTPSATGRNSISVTVSDDEGASSTKNFGLTIQ